MLDAAKTDKARRPNMTYGGETIINGTLYSVFYTEDGRVIYLP